MSLEKQNEVAKELVSKLFKLSMTLDGSLYLKHGSAWDLRGLANEIERSNVSVTCW